MKIKLLLMILSLSLLSSCTIRPYGDWSKPGSDPLKQRTWPNFACTVTDIQKIEADLSKAGVTTSIKWGRGVYYKDVTGFIVDGVNPYDGRQTQYWLVYGPEGLREWKINHRGF